MAGNPITEARQAVADVLHAALPDLPVYDGWPSNVSAPCLIVQTGRATHTARCLHDLETTITCIAPGGDNTAATIQLDDLIYRAMLAVNTKTPTRFDWDEPGTTTIAGNPYFAVVCRIRSDLTTP